MRWIKSLFATSEHGVDSAVFITVVAVLTMCGIAVYSVVYLHTAFSFGDFGLGVSATAGAGGAVKVARGYMSPGLDRPSADTPTPQ